MRDLKDGSAASSGGSRARNKFGFVLRRLERRLAAVEARLGLSTTSNHLNSDRPNAAETKETTNGDDARSRHTER
jgi:hypothetical protein